MKCPNCLAEVNSTNYPKDGLNVCPYCMNTWTTKQQAELSTLRSELTALKAENSRLRSGLEKLEWSDVQWDSQFCPVCTMEPHEGHNPDCWLSKLIKGDSNDCTT